MPIPLPYIFQNLNISNLQDARDSRGDVVGKAVPASYLDSNFSQLANIVTVSSTAPTPSYAGQLWLDTSTSPPLIKQWDGFAWQSRVSNADNSDKVDNFHASQTPSANTIVPLNADGILDLSETYVKSNVYTFRRVDLTNATNDYNLQVGEEAIIYFDTTQSTTKNLRIATNEGLYQMFIWAKYDTSINNNQCILYPNNQSYSNAFKIIGLWLNEETSLGYGTDTISGFLLGRIIEGGLLLCFFSTYRLGKFMIAWHKVVGSVSHGRLYHFVQRWDDTTTPWSSLGTINVENSSNGTLIILVKRLL
jgi:hypothetical protein